MMHDKNMLPNGPLAGSMDPGHPPSDSKKISFDVPLKRDLDDQMFAISKPLISVKFKDPLRPTESRKASCRGPKSKLPTLKEMLQSNTIQAGDNVLSIKTKVSSFPLKNLNVQQPKFTQGFQFPNY